ncbi:MAG: M42 family peptidase [Bacillota bacterium]|nr:M42 family peptidase [Bacillota bacterium]
MLSELADIQGVSGDEAKVRRFISEKLAGRGIETSVDTMGNFIARKNRGKLATPPMLSAHMDEVGLMITSIRQGGLLNFQTVGGIDSRVLVAKRVKIGREGLRGVIGAKPIHLQKKEEQEKPYKQESLYIDAGFNSREEAEKYISTGDYAVFDVSCIKMGNGFYRGKAFDDRAGCLVLLELLLENSDLCFNAAFTVQEEVGTRGAMVTAYTLQPQKALVVEATASADTPETEKEMSSTILGKGPAISLMDKTILVDRKMRDELADCAVRAGIPFQFRRFTGAGTEGGAIAYSREGVKTAVIAVPCRYIHSPHCVLKESDLQATVSLARAWLENNQ